MFLSIASKQGPCGGRKQLPQLSKAFEHVKVNGTVKMTTIRPLQRALRAVESSSTPTCSGRAVRSPSLPCKPQCASISQRTFVASRPWTTASAHRRPFSTSQCLYKKGGKAAREEKRANEPNSAAADDPYDFSALEADIAQALERLRNDLAKLRAGGRFNPEVVENLRVQPDKSSQQTARLTDLAQVIPKGRQVHIMVGEKDHVKPISSSIQSSSLSLTPQPDPTGSNPLLLILNIPPPTAESRRAAVSEASRAGEKAGTVVRDARGKQQKRLRAIELSKGARPDDLKKAKGLMEKIVEKGQGEVKKVVEEKRKVLEQG